MFFFVNWVVMKMSQKLILIFKGKTYVVHAATTTEATKRAAAELIKFVRNTKRK